MQMQKDLVIKKKATIDKDLKIVILMKLLKKSQMERYTTKIMKTLATKSMIIDCCNIIITTKY